MGDVVNVKDGNLWSQSRLADAFSMARRTVGKRLEGVTPAGAVKGHPVYHIKDAAIALLQVGRQGSFNGPQDLDQFPEARKAWYQSENERLKFETSVGQLLLATDVHRSMAGMVKAIVAALESIPDLLEHDAGLEPQAVDLVANLLDGVREGAAQKVRDAVRDEYKQAQDPER